MDSSLAEPEKKVKTTHTVAPERLKAIQMFKMALSMDYKENSEDEEFSNHILDLSYRIELGTPLTSYI